MKTPLKTTLCLSALVLLVTGCGLFGTNPSSPSAFERTIYDVQTNYVTQIITQTNTISVTNQVTVFQTNTVGQIVTVTNQVIQNIPIVVTVSNSVPEYTLTTSSTGQAAATGIGAVANAAVPGVGSAITMGILALLGAWGHLRSYKSTQTSTGLVQEVGAILESVKALPNGPQYAAALKAYLSEHQNAAGIAPQVLTLRKTVAASNVVNTISAPQVATTKVTKIVAPTLVPPA